MTLHRCGDGSVTMGRTADGGDKSVTMGRAAGGCDGEWIGEGARMAARGEEGMPARSGGDGACK